MIRKAIATLGLIALTASSVFAANAPVVADNNTRYGYTNNYGTSSSVSVEPGSQLRDGWFKFDTASVKSYYDGLYGVGGWQIDSIAFVGYSWDTSYYVLEGDCQFIYNTNDSWGETTQNWANQPSADDAGVVASFHYVPGSTNPAMQTISLDLDNAGLNADIYSGSLVTLHNVSTGAQVFWESKEYSSGAYASYLNISASQVVPEPGSFVALATGLVGFVGFGVRRIKK